MVPKVAYKRYLEVKPKKNKSVTIWPNINIGRDNVIFYDLKHCKKQFELMIWTEFHQF